MIGKRTKLAHINLGHLLIVFGCLVAKAWLFYTTQGYLYLFLSSTSLLSPTALKVAVCILYGYLAWIFILTDFVDILAIVIGKELSNASNKSNIPYGIGLTICFVAKGSQPEVLRSSIEAAIKVTINSRLNIRIEVVTDTPVKAALATLDRNGVEIVQFVVPANFTCPAGALFKARALEYARLNRTIFATHEWILHLDEESLITPSCLQGIEAFLSQNPSPMSIAQGEIRYNLPPFPYNMLSAIFDSSRTGGDLGRFRFQAQLVGKCLIGLHGSFLLTSRELEDLISFDSSPLTSVTEDAMFALKATERGAKLYWLQGYIRECSPQTISDFFKQRRRWFTGLSAISLSRELSFKTRSVLFSYLLNYRFSYLNLMILSAASAYIYSLSAILIFWIHCVSNPVVWVGTYRNFSDVRSRYQWVSGGLLILLSPIASILETFVPIYALIFPHSGFYVIDKSWKSRPKLSQITSLPNTKLREDPS